MKYILIASLLASAATAAPLFPFRGGNANGQATEQRPQQQQRPQKQGAAQNTQATAKGTQAGTAKAPVANSPTDTSTGTPTPADLATAVANWMADTSMVSNFLNNGASIQDDVQFKQAATVAFNAEVDELVHKVVIDSALGTDPKVIAANSTLVTGGAFQDVVDKLQQMSTQGQAAARNIDLINQNRCVNVLPNIDTYFAATGSDLRAVRPIVCDQTGVAGGVQGTGPTQPGQLPGTPAAAFAAAKAFGTSPGTGLVQNGTTTAGNNGTAGNLTPQGQQAGTAPVQGQAPSQSLTPSQQAATPVQEQGALPSSGVQTQQPAAQSAAAVASTVPGEAAQQQANGNGRTNTQKAGTATSATTSQKAGGRFEGDRQRFGFAV